MAVSAAAAAAAGVERTAAAAAMAVVCVYRYSCREGGTVETACRDSRQGSCLGRGGAWYRALRSYTACCLCVNANLPHEGSRHSDKEITHESHRRREL